MEVLRTAILDFCRRKKGKPVLPSEIIRQLFPEDWELFLDDIEEELKRMQEENLLERVVSDDGLSHQEKSIRLISSSKPK